MLELIDISKSYRGERVLFPLDLHIETGRTTVLIGPSGCGKSTLIRIMIGLIPADTGTVRFCGTVLTQQNCRTLRHRMGYVIQDGGLFPHLSAADNAALLARYLGWDEGRVASRLDELAQLTQLPREALSRYPTQLSGGQRQRVSLMRALMLDPDLLLLDEPMGALDPMIRSDLQADLKRIFATLGKTVVLVTHDLGEAAFLGHELILMRDGHLLQRGSILDMMQRPADPFVSRFINAQRSPLDSLDGPIAVAAMPATGSRSLESSGAA